MKNLISILLILLMNACGQNSNQSDEKSLSILVNDIKAKAMEVHDEVMPKMGELRRKAKDLRTKAESLKDEANSKLLLEAAEKLENANEEMMNWMRNFDQNFKGSEEEMKSYMENQLEKIKEVRTIMNESLEKSESLQN